MIPLSKKKINITTGVEFETGRIIDGKIEYGKKINIGNLPNTSDKTIAHNCGDVTFTDTNCQFSNSTGAVQFSMKCFGRSPSDTTSIYVYCSKTNIYISTAGDSSGYSGYITLTYIKN